MPVRVRLSLFLSLSPTSTNNNVLTSYPTTSCPLLSTIVNVTYIVKQSCRSGDWTNSCSFLVAFSTLVLKLSFSQSLSLHRRLSFPRADLLELWPLVVFYQIKVGHLSEFTFLIRMLCINVYTCILYLCYIFICRRHILYSYQITFSGITPANRNRLGRNFTGRHRVTWHAPTQTFGTLRWTGAKWHRKNAFC